MSSRSRGLIVGVSNYSQGIPKLPAVASDVREIALLLSSQEGTFPSDELMVLTDGAAKGQTILSALEKALGNSAPSDTVLVYLAGHGDFDTGGDYYFIPYDCDFAHLSTTAVPLTAIRDLFESSQSERVVLWLDFCHSGGILARDPNQKSEADAAKVIARTLEVVHGQGKVIMCACTSAQKAYEDAEHGLFTKYLLRGLQGVAANTNGEVTIGSLHDYIDHAIGSSRQRPMLFGKMEGRIVLMHSRSAGLNTAMQHKEPAAPVVVSDSGSWVMLGPAFFESESVRQAGNQQITVRIASTGSEDDAFLRGLKTEHHWQRESLSFAHRNDAYIVRVQNVESESSAKGLIWTITLVPEPVVYGGSFETDVALGTSKRDYSADEIAELRARRLLLNDPPPPNEGSRRNAFDSDNSLEMMIQGLGIPYLAKACVFRALYPQLRVEPRQFMKMARLAAIFALRAVRPWSTLVN